MNLIKRDIAVGYSSEITIRHATDVHDGNEGFHGRLFEKFLSIQESDKHGYCIFTGDIVDADRPSTRERKRLAYIDRPEVLTHEDEKDMDWLDSRIVPKYKRVAARCLGILDGDHYKIFSNGTTSGQYIARKTGIPYIGERMGYVGLRFFIPGTKQACRYTILARHGKGNASTDGADVSALVRQSRGFIADLYLGGHTHKENVHPEQWLVPDRNFENIRQKIIWYSRGGSFLRGFLPGKQLYPEREEYGPLVTGWSEVRLRVFCHGGKNLTITAHSGTMRAA